MASYWLTKGTEYIQTDSNYGTMLKNLVTSLVATSPELTIDSVDSDTTSTYKAYVRVVGSNIGYCIYNNSSYMHIYMCYWNASGIVVKSLGSSENFFGYSPSTSYACKVTSFGINPGVNFSVISNAYSSYLFVLNYGSFTSDNSGTEYWATVYSKSGFSYGDLWAFSDLRGYAYNSETDALEAISFEYTGSSTPSKNGYAYAFYPYAYNAYTANRGFINVKFGGLYGLKRLQEPGAAGSSSSGYYVAPGQTVNADGYTIQSLGGVYLID